MNKGILITLLCVMLTLQFGVAVCAEELNIGTTVYVSDEFSSNGNLMDENNELVVYLNDDKKESELDIDELTEGLIEDIVVEEEDDFPNEHGYASSDAVIERFDELDNSSVVVRSDQKPSLDELIESFPRTLGVHIAQNGEHYVKHISVSWYCVGDDYEESKGYYFQFSPSWDTSEYKLSRKLSEDEDVPYISVTVENIDKKKQDKKKNVDTELIKWATAFDSSTKEEDKEAVFNYLVGEMRLSNAAACGIMANIQYESSFSNTAIGDGGTSYGLCQWHAERFTRLRRYCGARGMDYRTTEGQLKYLEYELKKSYPDVYKYLRKVSNTKKGAYDAAYYWCVNFEKPSEMEKKGITRGNLARKSIWSIYKDRYAVYRIEYELDEGVNDNANPIAYSNLTDSITLANPSRDGYRFEGWYLDLEDEEPITEIVRELAGDITLYAKWSECLEEDLEDELDSDVIDEEIVVIDEEASDSIIEAVLGIASTQSAVESDETIIIDEVEDIDEIIIVDEDEYDEVPGETSDSGYYYNLEFIE